MEKNDLFEESMKRYAKFTNWLRREFGRSDAGWLLTVAAGNEYQKNINATDKDNTGEYLKESIKDMQEWMDFIRTKYKSCKSKKEFREWVIDNKEVLNEFGVNEKRNRNLKYILEGPDIELK